MASGKAPKKSAKKPGKKARKRVVHQDVVEQVTAAQDSTGKALLLTDGLVDLRAIDTAGRPIGPKNKADAQLAMAEIGEELAVLQEKLVAEAIRGGRRRGGLVPRRRGTPRQG